MSLLNSLRFITRHPLNRGHKLRSILRFVRWQIGSRLVPGSVVYDWVNGSQFLVRRGETGLTGNIYTGLHEFSDMGFLLHFLRREDLFVDVGANVGSYSILACAAVGARGIAFEPVPATFARLVENMRLNHLDDRVACRNQGVGSRRGEIAFTTGEDVMNHAIAADESCEHATIVEVVSLDDALHGESPALIKIDVEGYETPVLEGARETLQNPSLRAVIMELNGSGARYGFDEAKIVACMREHQFQMASYNPCDRALIVRDGTHSGSGNTLFIRDREYVEGRVRESQRYVVQGQEL